MEVRSQKNAPTSELQTFRWNIGWEYYFATRGAAHGSVIPRHEYDYHLSIRLGRPFIIWSRPKVYLTYP